MTTNNPEFNLNIKNNIVGEMGDIWISTPTATSMTIKVTQLLLMDDNYNAIQFGEFNTTITPANVTNDIQSTWVDDWYFVFAQADEPTDTPDIVLSTDPKKPSNAKTYYRFLSAVRNDSASGNSTDFRMYLQTNNIVYYQVKMDISIGGSGTASTITALGLTTDQAQSGSDNRTLAINTGMLTYHDVSVTNGGDVALFYINGETNDFFHFLNSTSSDVGDWEREQSSFSFPIAPGESDIAYQWTVGGISTLYGTVTGYTLRLGRLE